MRLISETSGLKILADVRRHFAEEIREEYEHRAKPCSGCETPGACCLDEHFVNVRVTRLETRAINGRVGELSEEQRRRVLSRAAAAVERYGLGNSPDESRTYACPLFEKGVGCLVHDSAKPLPCIAHACYERIEDLPPDDLLTEREMRVAEINLRVYGKAEPPVPIPVAIVSPGPV
jgi:hypothetical protein